VAILASLSIFGNFGYFGKFRIFSQFWQVWVICQIWSFLPHVAILGKIGIFAYFDHVLILVTFANFGNCSPF
jgi:hypothetical protein